MTFATTNPPTVRTTGDPGVQPSPEAWSAPPGGTETRSSLRSRGNLGKVVGVVGGVGAGAVVVVVVVVLDVVVLVVVPPWTVVVVVPPGDGVVWVVVVVGGGVVEGAVGVVVVVVVGGGGVGSTVNVVNAAFGMFASTGQEASTR